MDGFVLFMTSVRSGLASTKMQSKRRKFNWWLERGRRNNFLFWTYDDHHLRNGVIFWRNWTLFSIRSNVLCIQTALWALVNMN